MSAFTDFIEKIDSEKIALLEIDLAERCEEMLPYEAGIWHWKLTDYRKDVTFNFQNGSFTYGAFKSNGTGDLGENAIIKIISSLQVDNQVYTEVSSFANLRATNKSFLYEGSTIIYIHFDDFDPPDVFSKIELGILCGFSTKDIYLADNFYEGRIKSIPQISFKKDPLYFGILRYGQGNVGLINDDAFFDKFIESNIFGQAARVKFGGEDLAFGDYKTLFTGFVENFDINIEKFSLRISDYRKKLSRSLPPNTFEATTYPNIKSRNIGKPIPLGWSSIRNAPVMCVNEKESSPANYTFKICDTEFHSIKEITTVYVKDIEKTPSSTSLPNAGFDLASADYSPGDKVTCDFKGYDDSVAKDGSGALIQDSRDIIVDMLTNYLDITYSIDTYNTTEWEAASTYAVALWIGKKKDTVKAIEEICLSNFGDFIVEGDGRFTFRETDISAAAVKTIEIDEELTQVEARYNSAEYLTSVIVNYDKDQAENEYASYPYMEKETEIFDLYKTYREREFNTLLVSESDAQALAVKIMNLVDRIRPIFAVVAKTQASDLRIGDNVNVRLDRINKTWYGLSKCQVMGIDFNLEANRINLQLRYIEAA